jgi:hypothetical protein
MSSKTWSPRFAPGVWLQLLPLLVMFAMLWITAWRPFNLTFNTVKFWEYLVYGWMYAAAVYLLGLICLVKYLRAWWLAAVFAWLYLLLYGINAAFVHHMGFMLSPYFFWLKNLTHGMAFIEGYFTRWVVILTVAFALNSLLAAWLIRRHRKVLAQSHTRWLILLVVVLWVAPKLRDMGWFRPTAVAVSVLHTPTQGAWRVDQTYSLRNLAENPLVILGRVVYVYRLQPLQPRPAAELSAMSDVLKGWQLHLGNRRYAPLGLKPFDHIIMFSTESLSLDFLSPYNTNLPPELTPFYGSPAMTSRMFVNYQCTALPTQPGLAATFNSHPNVGGLLAGGNFEASLIKLLNAHGYATYFLMSGPETFLNDGVVFKQMGFQHVIGSQTWLNDPRYAPFVNDRGLMDRALFKIAVDLLEQNRDKKIFIDVMTGDTHSPYPREDYGSLQYPPTPDSVLRLTADPQARAILTGIFRHDYDIGQAVQEIQGRNLLTTNTLVILTADHNFPHGEVLDKIPGYPKNFLSRIPLAFLSGQPLPPPDDLRQIHSQLDFAPSIVHLLGWPVPDGWWGESVFELAYDAPSISKIGRNLMLTPLDGPRQIISLDHPNGEAEKALVKLFSSIYTNSPPAGTTAAGDGLQTNSP